MKIINKFYEVIKIKYNGLITKHYNFDEYIFFDLENIGFEKGSIIKKYLMNIDYGFNYFDYYEYNNHDLYI